MKIVLTGATGLVGKECVRIALLTPHITEVIAVGRREVSVPDGLPSQADKSKLKSVILDDFGSDWPAHVLEQLKGADACIWNLAVTPQKSKGMTAEELKKINHDYPFIGLKSMLAVANSDHPFRFIYTSAALSERDQDRALWVMQEERKLRGTVEMELLADAAQSKGTIELQITKPGAITDSQTPMARRVMLPMLEAVLGLPSVHVSDIAAAELHQAVNGTGGKDVMSNAGLVELGGQALKEWKIEKSA